MLMLKEGFRVTPQKEIAYSDFLKRQGGAKLEVLQYSGLQLFSNNPQHIVGASYT